MNIFFKKNSKKFKSDFLYVLEDSELIWEKKYFFDFQNFSMSQPSWKNIFFKKKTQKHFKSGFLYVLNDSEMIWEKNIFSIFRTKFLDFGSLWRPHRTVNQYILLVVLSLPINQQLRHRI